MAQGGTALTHTQYHASSDTAKPARKPTHRRNVVPRRKDRIRAMLVIGAEDLAGVIGFMEFPSDVGPAIGHN